MAGASEPERGAARLSVLLDREGRLTFDRQYSAVVAAEAFHWLDWLRVLPRIGASLVPGGHLILVERALAESLPWESELRVLIRDYSPNPD